MNLNYNKLFKNKRPYITMKILSAIVLIFVMLFSTSCSSSYSITAQKLLNEEVALNSPTQAICVVGQIKVHYINVGQGDAILIQQNASNLLIDAGTNASTSSLENYLKSLKIKKLDYLVLTHPHEDHIGGADMIIKNFNVDTLYMTNAISTTRTYRDVLAAMNSKNLKATLPALNSSFKLGDAKCTILGPINSESDNLNTYSIVIKVTFGNNKFLFTGDAESSNEKDMIKKGYDLSSDVLKIGHHGSYTSTSQAFLNKVNPKYAVISVGKGNDYGHPHKQIMSRMEAKNIKIYRTDESGTVIATSDGTDIKFNVTN